MKNITIVAAISFCAVVGGYFGVGVVNSHIDKKAGEIVEHTLSNNAITQLELLSEIQVLLRAGNINAANSKISEANETTKYILQYSCGRPKCMEAIKKHEKHQSL